MIPRKNYGVQKHPGEPRITSNRSYPILDFFAENFQKMFEMEKKLLCAFVAETLTRILEESNKDQNLYEFIKSTVFEIEFFDDVNKNYAILFLLSLSKHLGFYPTNINSSTTYFDSEFDWGRELNQENIGFLKNLKNMLALNY